ncbi:HK97-gp10 family putative phage morphogenesis protein [Luteimonas saliphila]|uniref:HK97-gp10 family putative phage morphogenesis protein n=1 Tax=Luteimonas saliphila TaxID=2804919 RepID=UPI00192E00FC
MADFEFRIEGLEEVKRKLKALPEKFAKRGMRRALRKGANIVRNAARNNAKRIDDPATREQIWKNTVVAGGGARRERQEGGPMMRIGVRGGAKPTSGDNGQPGGNTTHWRFIELGTSLAAAQPFMRPALANNVAAVTNAVVDAAKVELDKELAKL